MRKIQILGTGCSKCKTLAALAETAARELNMEFELEKVTEIQKIMAFGVMSTPGLALDGVVKISGRVPSIDELKRLLKE